MEKVLIQSTLNRYYVTAMTLLLVAGLAFSLSVQAHVEVDPYERDKFAQNRSGDLTLLLEEALDLYSSMSEVERQELSPEVQDLFDNEMHAAANCSVVSSKACWWMKGSEVLQQ